MLECLRTVMTNHYFTFAGNSLASELGHCYENTYCPSPTRCSSWERLRNVCEASLNLWYLNARFIDDGFAIWDYLISFIPYA